MIYSYLLTLIRILMVGVLLAAISLVSSALAIVLTLLVISESVAQYLVKWHYAKKFEEAMAEAFEKHLKVTKEKAKYDPLIGD